MSYSVKETYYTLQGEGAQAGRAAVFCRFTGCNLWSGREEDRETAICRFCDTDFLGTDGPGGGRFDDAAVLAEHVRGLWPEGEGGTPYVVCTGGEPLLQLDEPLVEAFHDRGLEVGIEINGTIPVPAGVDWICVSPKAGTDVVVRSGHELKLIHPQPGAEPERFDGWDFEHWFLQPMDGPFREENTRLATEFCLAHPRWRLSVQMHKVVGIP